ncbi:hypothetical protein FOCC_FOCC006549 [Frankliniella occidentalis]|nr:hypothetical protein FOCC_FOCC006549 [Frankliniella occidentalis]
MATHGMLVQRNRTKRSVVYVICHLEVAYPEPEVLLIPNFTSVFACDEQFAPNILQRNKSSKLAAIHPLVQDHFESIETGRCVVPMGYCFEIKLFWSSGFGPDVTVAFLMDPSA